MQDEPKSAAELKEIRLNRKLAQDAEGIKAMADIAAADHDDTLILLFMCCHPALTSTSAIALTLRVQLSYLPNVFILDPVVLANYSRLTLVQRLERRDTIAVTFHDIGLGPLYSLTLEAIDLNDNERDFGIEKEALVPTITYRPIRPLTVQLGVSTELNNVTVFNDTAAASTEGLIRALVT